MPECKLNENKKEKGITLIALVITIIVLLILAGVSIATLVGDNGILGQATKAKIETRAGEVEEEVNLWKIEISMAKHSNIKVETLDQILERLLNKNSLTSEEVAKIKDENNKNKEITIGSKTISFNVEIDSDDLENNLPDSYEDLLIYSPFDDIYRPSSEQILNEVTDKEFMKTIPQIGLKKDNAKFGKGSVYFPGTAGGRITVPNSELNLNTKDFTVQFWAYPEEQTMPYALFFGDDSNTNLNFFIYDTNLGSNMSLSIGATRILNLNKTYTKNEWTHYAVVRKDGIFYVYENGNKIGETASYTTSSIIINNLSIGGNISTNNTAYKGYIDDFSIFNTAIYTKNFQPPNSPQNTANLVYASFDKIYNSINIGIEEKITKKYFTIQNESLTRVTDQNKKNGKASCYFLGTTAGRITIPNPELNLGTKDFTVQFWAYPEEQIMPYSLFFGDDSNKNLNFFIYDTNSGSNMSLSIGETRILNLNKTYTKNEWTHYAVVRKDGIFYVYENGNKIGETESYTTSSIIIQNLSIGGNISINDTAYKGYIDDFMIYNKAIYTQNFIP